MPYGKKYLKVIGVSLITHCKIKIKQSNCIVKTMGYRKNHGLFGMSGREMSDVHFFLISYLLLVLVKYN